MSGDPIEEYLARLHASLRTPPDRTAQLLAEAEDHLRESTAAGEALGLTERDAQEAAIAAFGPVRAVARAHRRPAATCAELAMIAWQVGTSYAAMAVWYAAQMARTIIRQRTDPGTTDHEARHA